VALQILLALALAADPRAQLEALKARKAAEEAAAKLLSEREVSILDTLADADRSLADAEAEARRADAERALSERKLRKAQAGELAAQASFDARLVELRPRLAAHRKMGQLGELRVLVASASLADLVKRRYLMDRILSHDFDVLRQARASLGEREHARAERAAETRRLSALAGEAQGRRADALARREERRTLLDAVRNARGLHEKAAAEAAEQQAKLAEFIAALPPPRAGQTLHTGFAVLRGRLPYPAGGAIEVGFGKVVNPRFNTVTVQKGVDIRARRGEPVRSVAPGRVVHAGWFKGYGNLVIVDHGDGYHTLVAHLESMSTAMGEEVSAGSLLGAVGDTGSLKGPYLYFEVREKGRPVDPRLWLAPGP
jgi:septal ring factor EnvC (AmiA/AmiB activator)